jgi:signal transduction histidine kinase
MSRQQGQTGRGARLVHGLTRTALVGLWARVSARASARAPLAVDSLRALLVALVALAALVASTHRAHTALSGLAVALTLAATLPLAARQRWPLAVLAIVAAAQAVYLATIPLGETLTGLGLAVALYTMASRTERGLALRLAAGVVVVNGLVLLAAVALGRPGSGPSLVLMTVLAVGSWSLGDNVRTRRAYLAGLEERARRLEREREENARRAVEEERGRIARARPCALFRRPAGRPLWRCGCC